MSFIIRSFLITAALFTLQPLFATLAAPEGFPLPQGAYTVIQYKKNPVKVTPGSPANVNFKSYANLNWHGTPNTAYTLRYEAAKDSDQVTGVAFIPANWDGKQKITLNVTAQSSNTTGLRRNMDLKLVSVTPALDYTENGALSVEITAPKTSGVQVFFDRVQASVTEPPNGFTPAPYAVKVRTNGLFAVKTTVGVKTNNYPGLWCDSIIFDPGIPETYLKFKLTGNSTFLNQNIRLDLYAPAGSSYTVMPGGGTLDIEVKDNVQVTAAFLTPSSKVPLRIGQTDSAVIQTGGFALKNETNLRITLGFSGSAKLGTDMKVTVPNPVEIEKPKKNQLVFDVIGTDLATLILRPVNDYKSAGKGKDFKVTILSVCASSKKLFPGEVNTPKTYTVKIEEPATSTAVGLAPNTDTQLWVIPPAGSLANPPATGATGAISNASDTCFLYTYTDLTPRYPLGFIDRFEYAVSGKNTDQNGLVKIYSGSKVTTGCELNAGPDTGTFLKTPVFFAYLFDPVKDPNENKNPKKYAIKVLSKADRTGTDTALTLSFVKAPLLYHKNRLKECYGKGIFFADSAPYIQALGAGAELLLNWKQGKAGDSGYVDNLKNSSFGAAIFVAPSIDADSPIRIATDGTVTDSVLKEGVEILVSGFYFSTKPKGYLEYRELGKIKKVALKSVFTKRGADSSQYTWMDSRTGRSQVRLMMPKQTVIDKIKASGSPVYLIIDSRSGLTSSPVFIP